MISYPKVHALGHRHISNILIGDNIVEEKVDGSSLNFSMQDGELIIHSHSAKIYLEAPQKMFIEGIEYIKSIQHKLIPNYFYHGEYLQKKKHNTLEYGRIPKNHIMIFDIEDPYGNPFSYNIKAGMAYDIGLEVVPLLATNVKTVEEIKELLNRDSILGGSKIEGVVIKNYNQLTFDGKYAVGKYVSEAFKEKHIKDWKSNNPNSKDLITTLVEELRTDARYYKAVQHLREQGTLEESPRDIGNLFKEVVKDIEEEEKEYILERLWKYYGKEIKSRVCAGIPEWYKNKLLENLKEDNHEIN